MLLAEKMTAKAAIERRSDLSYEEFASTYLYPNKPVIVTDALKDWRAMKRWTTEFFKREFGGMKFTIQNDLARKGDYRNGNGALEYTMAEFIDRVVESTEQNPAPYFRNQILADLFPSLLADIEPLPSYFLPNWLPDRFAVKRVREVLNRGAALELYIGGRGSAFPVLHYDGSGTHAFLMQVYGRKKFIVYPPDQERFLYPSPERQNLSELNSIEEPDLKRFPLFANAVPTLFTLEPGELLFVPSHWWHTTKMLTPSITLSMNVLNQSNWHELVKFVAMRRSPVAVLISRIYLTGAGTWRAWRDREWRKQPSPAAQALMRS